MTFLGLKIICFFGSLGVLCYLTYLLFAEDCEGVNNSLFVSVVIIVVCEWFAITAVSCCFLCSLTGLLGYLIFIGLTATNLQSSRYFSDSRNDSQQKSTVGETLLDDHRRHEEEKSLLKKEKAEKEKFKKIYSPYHKHFISGTDIPDPLKD
ncbi:hypothetical protein FDP41_007861 [Naegleria fowleri]|uniref:Uncharacterized protein n=1 Tax=Naegleria fowleri TaxID=5763 RepID=A0A6A5C861_NAEFO|nr:uncharacterized protein FDP41_007861 [Naegleria fowleri]KAF0983946.1 hypothetical protein FDP41_007861 [Naegleria fowleri]